MYVVAVVPLRVIVLPLTPSPDNTPSAPQSTVNVPAADIENWKVAPADKFVVVMENFGVSARAGAVNATLNTATNAAINDLKFWINLRRAPASENTSPQGLILSLSL